MMWSQRGDKEEGPAQEEGGVRSSGETLPRGKARRAKWGKAKRARKLRQSLETFGSMLGKRQDCKPGY